MPGRGLPQNMPEHVVRLAVDLDFAAKLLKSSVADMDKEVQQLVQKAHPDVTRQILTEAQRRTQPDAKDPIRNVAGWLCREFKNPGKHEQAAGLRPAARSPGRPRSPPGRPRSPPRRSRPRSRSRSRGRRSKSRSRRSRSRRAPSRRSRRSRSRSGRRSRSRSRRRSRSRSASARSGAEQSSELKEFVKSRDVPEAMLKRLQSLPAAEQKALIDELPGGDEDLEELRRRLDRDKAGTDPSS